MKPDLCYQRQKCGGGSTPRRPALRQFLIYDNTTTRLPEPPWLRLWVNHIFIECCVLVAKKTSRILWFVVCRKNAILWKYKTAITMKSFLRLKLIAETSCHIFKCCRCRKVRPIIKSYCLSSLLYRVAQKSAHHFCTP